MNIYLKCTPDLPLLCPVSIFKQINNRQEPTDCSSVSSLHQKDVNLLKETNPSEHKEQKSKRNGMREARFELCPY